MRVKGENCLNVYTLWLNNLILASIASEGDVKYKGFMHKDALYGVVSYKICHCLNLQQ